jgi:hypothetical protein
MAEDKERKDIKKIPENPNNESFQVAAIDPITGLEIPDPQGTIQSTNLEEQGIFTEGEESIEIDAEETASTTDNSDDDAVIEQETITRDFSDAFNERNTDITHGYETTVLNQDENEDEEETLLFNSQDEPQTVTGVWNLSGDQIVIEGQTAKYTLSFEGILPIGQSVTLAINTGPGLTLLTDAIPNNDYISIVDNLITFTGGGPTSVDFLVQTNTDSILEGNEEYTVNVSFASDPYGTIIDDQVQTVIIDSEPSLEWNITGDQLVNEGNVAQYIISYSGGTLAAGQIATIVVNTGPGLTILPDANAGSDYLPINSITLTFVGGEDTSQIINVQTLNDIISEGNEEYTVSISNNSIGTINNSTVETVILDSEPPIEWNISGDQFINEGDIAQYSISYNGGILAPGQIATIVVNTGPRLTILPDANAGSDYLPTNSLTLTFIGGQAPSQIINVQTLNDTLIEGEEEYTVSISNNSIGTINNPTVQTVISDLTPPEPVEWQLSGDLSVLEGDVANYTVHLSNGQLLPGQTATLDLQTLDGSIAIATENQDYVSIDGQTISISYPATSASFTVQTNSDNLQENTEHFRVQISNPTIGTVDPNFDIVETDILDQFPTSRAR